MHASFALCVMLMGGPVAPGPEPEIVFVPLKDDLSALNSMQELEWKTRLRNGYKLPRVPTVVDDQSSGGGDGRGMRRGYGAPTDQNAQRRQQQQVMPMSPTDPGGMGQSGMGQAGGGQYGQMPSMPGSGLSQGYQQGTSQGGSPGYTPNGTGRYDPSSTNNMLSHPINNNYGGYGTMVNAPRANYTPTAGDTMSGIMNTANLTNIGVTANPMASQKPFNDYQRPSGYSPWMQLYNTPTNNGTVSTYTSAVQPTFQQQQVNQQMAEQIQGVRNTIAAPHAGTPGTEMPVSGAGLYNPYGSINYTNPMGR
jgi:hypothetical protein